MIAAVLSGFVTSDVYANGNYVRSHYSLGILLVALPLLVFALRNYYVFWNMLKHTHNPVLHNQILALLVGISVLVGFSSFSLPAWFNDFPIAHYGNLINAFILSYGVIRHRLIDMRIVLRRGTAWFALGVISVAIYWLVLIVVHRIFNFDLDLMASFVATILAFSVGIFAYRVRSHLFKFMSRAFQGSSYDYHQRLNEFTNKIHNVFSLKEQGGELLILLLKAINVREACLLFPESGNDDYKSQFSEPKDGQNQLANLRLRSNNPIVKYLEREQKTLQRENLDILPAFLVLGEKRSGRYSLEDLSVIENTTSRVAVSMEKEYLREQLREREEELSVINNSSVILSSSLDIQEIFGTFIDELKKVVEVDWASIVLIEEDTLCCMALSSPENSAYQIGERVPMEGTGTGWVVTQKKTFVEPDLSQERYFNTSEHFYTQGLRTTAYLPLIAKGSVIGSFIVACKTPNVYTQRHTKLLEQLAAQIAMPLENSLLYAKAEKKARIDELTSLYNRRSLDEMIDSEISRHSRYGGAFSLAILDLDSFKSFNDTYGHLAGDGLLQEIGRNIKSAIRTSDYAFRYGGDEFAILLPETGPESARVVIQKVQELNLHVMKKNGWPITLSMGVVSFISPPTTVDKILKLSDVLMYKAKNGGKNTIKYTVYGDQINRNRQESILRT
ncbi:MAG: diguanylate cyclase [Acidobacteriia bacterium]|nr:diguanylate cyclase [Terriglobia bacterium]